MRQRIWWREALAPLLVIGMAFGLVAGGPVIVVPDLDDIVVSARSHACPLPQPTAARPPVDRDLADLRHGPAGRVLAEVGGPGSLPHPDTVSVDDRSARPPGRSRAVPPPRPIRSVLDLVTSRLGRAPPAVRAS